jgi:tRNA A-37 threonylcarbamoyl transferase component Bud32
LAEEPACHEGQVAQPGDTRDSPGLAPPQTADTLLPGGPVSQPDFYIPPLPVAPEVPETDEYQFLEVLGRGGMGVVYKARQIHLNRLVALKMILAGGHASSEDMDRFRIEAQAAAGLHHPNIVQIYDFGEREGKPFIALEFVEGKSLLQKLDGTPWEPRTAAHLVETLALAMHHAHEEQVVHRDLKPANVLLTADGQPKITDFGLAKRMDRQDTGHTGSQAILGTPAYMAPEQAQGKARDVGRPADVYSLGVILYELVVGRVPFRGETLVDTIQLVLHEEPEPPPPTVPLDLRTICLKCLEKDPRRRYATAQDLANELRRFLESRPILARPVPWYERSWKLIRRHKLISSLVAAIIGGVFFTFVLGFVAIVALRSAYQEAQSAYQEAQAKEKIAEEKAEEAEKQKAAAMEATDREKKERQETEKQKQAAEDAQRRTEEARKRTDQAFLLGQDVIDELLKGLSPNRMRQDSGTIPLRKDRVERILQVVNQLTQVSTVSGAQEQSARANRMAGDLYGLLGTREAAKKALDHYRQAIDVYQKLLKKVEEPADQTSIYLSAIGQAGGLVPLWSAGWTAETRLKCDQRVNYQLALEETYLGLWLVQKGTDPENSRKTLDSTLDLLKEIDPKQVGQPEALSLLHAQVLNNRGFQNQSVERFQDADADYREAGTILEDLHLSRNHPRWRDCELERALVDANLAAVLPAQTRKELLEAKSDAEKARLRDLLEKVRKEADDYYLKAITRLDQLARDNPRDPIYARELGRAYVNQATSIERWDREPKQSEAIYAKAVERFRKLSEDNKNIPTYRDLYATSLLAKGEFHLYRREPLKAEPLLEKARSELLELKKYADAPAYQLNLARVCNTVGSHYLRQGELPGGADKLEKASERLQEALAVLEVHVKNQYDDAFARQLLDTVRNNLIACYHQQAKLEQQKPGSPHERWQRVEVPLRQMVDLRRKQFREFQAQGGGEACRLACLELAGTLLAQAELLIRLENHEAAAGVFEELAARVPPSWPRYPEAVQLLGRALHGLALADQAGTPENEAQIRHYGLSLLALLERACAGKETPSRLLPLLQGREFDLLRQHPAFKAPFQEVMRKLEEASRQARK